MESEEKIFATLDVGSNSTLTLIAACNDNGDITPIVERTTTVRFGAAISEDFILPPSIINKCADVVSEYVERWKKTNATLAATAATGILRRAVNFDMLTETLKKQFGFDLDLASEEREALLVYISARRAASDRKKIMTLDLGGFSCEIGYGQSDKPEHLQSEPIGCVTLTQKYWLENRPSKKTVAQAREEIGELISRYKLPENISHYTLVASGGTATSLTALAQNLKVYRHEHVHQSRLELSQIAELLEDNFLIKSAPERAVSGVMSKNRAEVILAGALVLEAFMKHAEIDWLIVNERGLRWGLLYDYLAHKESKKR